MIIWVYQQINYWTTATATAAWLQVLKKNKMKQKKNKKNAKHLQYFGANFRKVLEKNFYSNEVLFVSFHWITLKMFSKCLEVKSEHIFNSVLNNLLFILFAKIQNLLYNNLLRFCFCVFFAFCFRFFLWINLYHKTITN